MFTMDLTTRKPLNEIIAIESEKREYEEEFDNELSVVGDICNIFQDSGEILFNVSWFGEKWYTDCFCDLSTVIEQLPDILEKINGNNFNFELDFYEQGLERILKFEDSGDDVTILCVSRTDWNPSQDKTKIAKKDIKKIFKKMYHNFINYANLLCPELIRNPLIAEWLKIDKVISDCVENH